MEIIVSNIKKKICFNEPQKIKLEDNNLKSLGLYLHNKSPSHHIIKRLLIFVIIKGGDTNSEE